MSSPKFAFLFGMIPAIITELEECVDCTKVTIPDAFSVKGSWEAELLERLQNKAKTLNYSSTFVPDIQLITLMSTDFSVYISLMNGVTECLSNYEIQPLQQDS